MGAFSEYLNLTRGDKSSEVEVRGQPQMIICQSCGNEVRAGIKFCTQCGRAMTEVIQESQDVVTEKVGDVKLQVTDNSYNNIKGVINNARAETNLGLQESVMLAEMQIHQYDMTVSASRLNSLKLLVKLTIVLMIPVALLLELYGFGIEEAIGSIKDIVQFAIFELIGVFVIWIIMFVLQWFNRHKMKSKWSVLVIRLLYYLPIIILTICFYNKYLWILWR